MNERLRIVRENHEMSRAAFGQRIGVSGDVINNLERGRVEMKEHIIKLVCSEFSINEAWFRTGIGEMKQKTPADTMEQLRKEYNLDEFSFNLVYAYLKLGAEQRKTVRDFLYNQVLAAENADYLSGVPKVPTELEQNFPPCKGADDSKTG